ncbi:MAG: excalibur calcium-binding domain-containing protein [Rhodobacter sp.]|nr:excalibur calcium-binding domain-containing protein [Rhodobacter sp.]
MQYLAFDNLAVLLVLVLLAGSLLGSVLSFMLRGGNATADNGYPGYDRPRDWPSPAWASGGQTSYLPTHRDAPRRRAGLLTIAFTAALAYAVATAGLFAYQSPWPLKLDLRHLAATTHCEAARLVELPNAKKGAPGYHRRHDPDGNGIACDTPVAAEPLQIATAETGPEKLSTVQLAWPQSAMSQ